MRLETERLILRPFEERDRVPFAALNADPNVMRYFPATRTAVETDWLLASLRDGLARNGIGFLAAELRDTGTCIGMIGLAFFDDDMRQAIPGHPKVEVGWRLARDYWGQGLAPEGAVACLDYAWKRLGLPEVVAITYRDNLPSRRVMEKIGMTYDPHGDFVHPRLAPDHTLSRHVLYRIENPGAVRAEQAASSA